MDISELSSKIAKDIGLSEVQVEEINRVQWKFLLETIQCGAYAPVEVFYLGKFYQNERYTENGKKTRGDHRRLGKLAKEKTRGGEDS